LMPAPQAVTVAQASGPVRDEAGSDVAEVVRQAS